MTIAYSCENVEKSLFLSLTYHKTSRHIGTSFAYLVTKKALFTVYMSDIEV